MFIDAVAVVLANVIAAVETVALIASRFDGVVAEADPVCTMERMGHWNVAAVILRLHAKPQRGKSGDSIPHFRATGI